MDCKVSAEVQLGDVSITMVGESLESVLRHGGTGLHISGLGKDVPACLIPRQAKHKSYGSQRLSLFWEVSYHYHSEVMSPAVKPG